MPGARAPRPAAPADATRSLALDARPARALALTAPVAATLAATLLALLPLAADAAPRVPQLQALAERFEQDLAARRPALWTDLRASRAPAMRALLDDRDLDLAYLGPRGRPMWRQVENLDAARTVSTDELWPGGSSGLGLSGSTVGPGRLAIWDAGGVRTSHVEFGGRADQIDSPSSTHYHSTHCAGTLIATGVDPDAHGMSFEANLDCYDWGSDNSEMATAAAAGLWLSSHSYGYVTGWSYSSGSGDWYWYGDMDVDANEDYGFGFYSQEAADWDQIAYDAPEYLIVKSAGNDRSTTGPGPGGGHYHWDTSSSGWVWATDSHQADGADGGYDTVAWNTTAKNILVVGAVDDIPSGWSDPSDVVMSSFSSWGPTDDGRIKPDVVANGIGLWSTMDGSNTDYASLSGTSMATPSACGTANLLVELYRQTHADAIPSAALQKAWLLQTASEAGPSDGPDYSYGWGLVDALAAATLIDDDATEPGHLVEATLANGNEDLWYFTLDEPAEVRVTMAWTDPPGSPPAPALDDPTPMLVNDLDMQIRNGPVPLAAVYGPWVLDPANPSAAASTGDNDIDNVEQVWVASLPAGNYEIPVSHEGPLTGGSQAYALASSVALTDVPPGLGVEGRLDRATTRLDAAVAPNPFARATSIAFALPEAASVRIDVVDVAGRVVRVLGDGPRDAGAHRIDWDGRDDAGRRLASGVYFARVSAAGERVTEKLVLLRTR